MSNDLSENHTSLWDFFKASDFNTNKLPKEKDAIRKAKIINYDINDNNDNKTVDDFVENKISELKGTDDEIYWKLVQDIDVKTDYDLENEIKKDYIKYKIC